MLLNRPLWHKRKTETINDLDAFLTNFWRAAKYDPEAVAEYADWPVNEIDLAARRDWLFAQTGHIEAMMRDPGWYDVKLAGVWVWGVCSTIGNTWKAKSTHLGAESGVHRAGTHLGDAGRGTRREYIVQMIGEISARLDRTRVMCGDWKRVTSPTVTTHNGDTGMLLDPPYIDGCCAAYSHNTDVRQEVREYAIAHGHEMKIALCGYEGEHDMPPEWEVYAWSTSGGYGSRAEGGRGRKNKSRERIWFSEKCYNPALLNVLTLPMI